MERVIPRWQKILGYVLSALPMLAFLPSAFMKIAQPGPFLEGWTKMYPATTARPIGIIELLVVIIYWIPKTRVLGAILMTGYLGGAISTHVRMGDGNWPIPLLIGVMIWAGLAGVEGRLRDLIPFRS